MVLKYKDVDEEFQRFFQLLSKETDLDWQFNSTGDNGSIDTYHKFVGVGYQCIAEAAVSGEVNPKDYVAVYKQCFHEYRHWIQHTQFFKGVNSENLPNDFIRLMAEESMIADMFPNYVHPKIMPDNYLNAVYEIDAEEYALKRVRKELSKKFIQKDLDYYICEGLADRGSFWWGDTPVHSVDEAIEDLHNKKFACKHLVLTDEVSLNVLCGIALEFTKSGRLMHEYRDLLASKQNAYLVRYIAEQYPQIAFQYPVIEDEFGEQYHAYMLERRQKQNVEQRSSRVSKLKDMFGNILGKHDEMVGITAERICGFGERDGIWSNDDDMPSDDEFEP